MSTGEHLDPESTAPDLPDGYDPDGGWTAQEWWDALGYGEQAGPQTAPDLLDDVDWWHQEGARLSHPEWFDEQRDADFDDEEHRP